MDSGPISKTVKDVAGSLCDGFDEWANEQRLHDIPDDYGWNEMSAFAADTWYFFSQFYDNFYRCKTSNSRKWLFSALLFLVMGLEMKDITYFFVWTKHNNGITCYCKKY